MKKYRIFTVIDKLCSFYMGDYDTLEEAFNRVFQFINSALKDALIDFDINSNEDIMELKMQQLTSKNGYVIWYTLPDNETEIPIYIVEQEV